MPRHALKPLSEKTPSEMTYQELRDTAAREGLPCPDDDAPQEVWNQWFVAHIFMFHHRNIEDKLIAATMAANVILEHPCHKDMLPYLEQALGRKLSPEEIARRRVLTIEDLL